MVLTIDGKIGCTNPTDRLDFDIAKLKAIPVAKIKTTMA